MICYRNLNGSSQDERRSQEKQKEKQKIKLVKSKAGFKRPFKNNKPLVRQRERGKRKKECTLPILRMKDEMSLPTL